MMTMKPGHRYEIGNQPCQNLKRGDADVAAQGVANVHQCPVCWGNRTWCDNCCRDHHDGGWETCKPEAYKDHEWSIRRSVAGYAVLMRNGVEIAVLYGPHLGKRENGARELIAAVGALEESDR